VTKVRSVGRSSETYGGDRAVGEDVAERTAVIVEDTEGERGRSGPR
jgi:hypothetical protein